MLSIRNPTFCQLTNVQTILFLSIELLHFVDMHQIQTMQLPRLYDEKCCKQLRRFCFPKHNQSYLYQVQELKQETTTMRRIVEKINKCLIETLQVLQAE